MFYTLNDIFNQSKADEFSATLDAEDYEARILYGIRIEKTHKTQAIFGESQTMMLMKISLVKEDLKKAQNMELRNLQEVETQLLKKKDGTRIQLLLLRFQKVLMVTRLYAMLIIITT